MRVDLLPIFSDNYCYIITDEHTGVTAIVDPAEPETVKNALKQRGILDTLGFILTTHKHWDHAGGNEWFQRYFADKDRKPVIVGSKHEVIPAATQFVGDGDSFKIGNLEVRVLFTPCHTSGHVLYHITDPHTAQSSLFSGDTLFLAGCGRFFEGNATQMCEAMNKIAKLPHETKVYCGHEYSVKNLEFALTVEPENTALQAKLAECKQKRSENVPTIPSTLAEELSYNPFMRAAAAVPSILSATAAANAETAMAEVRRRKDAF